MLIALAVFGIVNMHIRTWVLAMSFVITYSTKRFQKHQSVLRADTNSNCLHCLNRLCLAIISIPDLKRSLLLHCPQNQVAKCHCDEETSRAGGKRGSFADC
jgi:hypothetical protein